MEEFHSVVQLFAKVCNYKLCCYAMIVSVIFRFDLFLYKACLCLKCVPLESRTVYHVMVREMCGQFYYMCAQYLYFEDNRTTFSSSYKEYSFQVGLKLT